MKAWYVKRAGDNVTIYDSMDVNGNGNVRFHGTIDAALTHYAFAMQALDEQRAHEKTITEEIERLKRKAGE